MDSDDYYDEVDELDSGEGLSSDEAEDGSDGDHIWWRKHYTVVEEERIRQLQENDIAEVSTLLSVSRGTACTLLRCRNWSPGSVFEEWFAGEERIRHLHGLLPERESRRQDNETNVLCNICFEETEVDNTLSASCGHPFCLDCWKIHLSISINGGPGCLSLRCPEPRCKANAGLDLIDQLASDEDKQRYYKYLFQSYIEGHGNLKWCPAPGCDLAIWLDDSNKRESSVHVICDCSHRFCWNCTEESHRPVNCETVKNWIKLSNSEAENTTWITAFTKPCPKCNRNIEKNQGCNHMTCGKPCGHEFCWLCLGTYSDRHSCNRYEGEHDKRERNLEATRKNLMRYAHYYTRWASNHKSRGIVLSDLEWARGELVDMLVESQKVQFWEVQPVIGAMEQIAECRRVLKWSYAYGYYLASKGIEFFEHMQGVAEGVLERLHHCVETELAKYVKTELPSHDFKEYLEKVVHLTNVLDNHFQNLVRALENGF